MQITGVYCVKICTNGREKSSPLENTPRANTSDLPHYLDHLHEIFNPTDGYIGLVWIFALIGFGLTLGLLVHIFNKSRNWCQKPI